jgi:hypothetical protein
MATVVMAAVLLMAQLISSLGGAASANMPLALLLTPVAPAGDGKAATPAPRSARRIALARTSVPTRLIASLVQPGELEAQAQAAEVAQVQPAPQAAAPAARLPAPAPAVARAPLVSNEHMINSVPVEQIVVLDDATRARIREIFAQGQALGRNPRAFARVGDSTMAYPPLMSNFGTPGSYRLGRYAFLQPTIDYFIGSFWHESGAVKVGMHTWTEFDPAWAPQPPCDPDEAPLACEFRLTNPAVVIIRLGANDFGDPVTFERSMRQILDFWISRGVIPILGTKPDRQEGSQNTINRIVAQIASNYRIPLWDYDKVAATIPNRGLDKDNIHMLLSKTHDYTSDVAYENGDPLEDLTCLMVLDAVRKAVH